MFDKITIWEYYSNDMKKERQATIPRNSFKRSWTIMCEKNSYYFKDSRVRGIIIYHTYESELLAKK